MKGQLTNKINNAYDYSDKKGNLWNIDKISFDGMTEWHAFYIGNFATAVVADTLEILIAKIDRKRKI